MIIEYADISINIIFVARVIAITLFLVVVWRVHQLQRKIKHIEALTKQNYSELQVRLAEAIGMAEESVWRDQQRDPPEHDPERE